MKLDRDEILASIDLRDLATHLVGAPKQTGATQMWPSPVPGHSQTGKTPPMSIKDYPDGAQRWHCFATGENGTAIDLVMTAKNVCFKDALTYLADRSPTQTIRHHRPHPATQTVRVVGQPAPKLLNWINQCQHALTPTTSAWRYLTDQRGITPETIKANKLGYNTNRHKTDDGLPKAEGVVLPVFDPDGAIIYAQVRTLNWPDVKYVSIASNVAANPSISWHNTPTASNQQTLIITEGIPDALAANQAGFDAVAFLGTGTAKQHTAAQQIITHAAHKTAVVCFDSDQDGRNTACHLALTLAADMNVRNITPPVGHDLETWLQTNPNALQHKLTPRRAHTNLAR